MAVLGAVGLFFSGLIMQDKVTLLSNPDYIPACTVNAIVSCTDVMASPQASAFGFANPYIGLVGFALVTFFGVSLAAGVRFPEWMWAGELLGLIFAVASCTGSPTKPSSRSAPCASTAWPSGRSPCRCS